MRFLTEPEAWREVAVRVDRLRECEGYLCDQIGYLSGEYPATWPPFAYSSRVGISGAVASSMKERVRSYIGFAASAYEDFYEYEEDALAENRKGRVMAALWFALEAASVAQPETET